MSTKDKTNQNANSKTRKTTKGDSKRYTRYEKRVAEQEPENNEPVFLPALISQSKSVLDNLKHFGWDLLGTFLALLAILTLLGLLGLAGAQ